MSKPVFVFGSNLAGRHGKGAALYARHWYGAIYGQGVGYQGNSYAIPTKDRALKSLPIARVREYVSDFMKFASEHPELSFSVTKIGCGLAGFKEDQIEPLFNRAPGNCQLPKGWREHA